MRFLPTPENRSAREAVQLVAACLCAQRVQRGGNPLYIHGLPGTGKTHLVSELLDEITRRNPRLVVRQLQAADFEGPQLRERQEGSSDNRHLPPDEADLSGTDLLVIEDLQHLASRRSNQAGVIEAFVQMLDDRVARQQQVIVTANAGPALIAHLPARLVSRLAGGLVIALEPLGSASRLALLDQQGQRRQLAVSRDVLAWLAENIPGGTRQLLGAVVQLEALSRLHALPLAVATVAEHFRAQVEETRPTVDRIAERVGKCFQVSTHDLQSRQRSQRTVMPRQVGMYLARKLTGLSLDQIGAFFGGRDHSTVLHACAKVEKALTADPCLSGMMKQLNAELC